MTISDSEIPLSMMIPGLFAGALQESVGYPTFFIIVMLACAVTYIVTAFLKIDPEFGKKKKTVRISPIMTISD